MIADPGTYRYNAAPPWRNALSSTTVHNTVTVDGADQMDRGSNFLWLTRAHGVIEAVDDRRIAMSHDGYRQLGVTHRRTVQLTGPNRWTVTDDVLGTGSHRLGWTWLLPECELSNLTPGRAALSCPAGALTLRLSGSPAPTIAHHAPDEADPRGWWSPIYGQRLRATCLTVSWSGLLPAQIVTEFDLDPELVETAG